MRLKEMNIIEAVDSCCRLSMYVINWILKQVLLKLLPLFKGRIYTWSWSTLNMATPKTQKKNSLQIFCRVGVLLLTSAFAFTYYFL